MKPRQSAYKKRQKELFRIELVHEPRLFWGGISSKRRQAFGLLRRRIIKRIQMNTRESLYNTSMPASLGETLLTLAEVFGNVLQTATFVKS